MRWSIARTKFRKNRIRVQTRRMRKGGATPSSVVTGTTRYEDVNIGNNYNAILSMVNGISQAGYDVPNRWSQATMHVTPSRIAELMARQFVYNQYRILEVTWILKRGDNAATVTGPIRANYKYGSFAALMPNVHNETFPEIGSMNTSVLLAWMIQNKGKMVKISDKFAKIKVPAMVVRTSSFEETQNGGEVEHSTYEKMPWMELNPAKMDQMSIGQCVFVQPTIHVDTFYEVHATDSEQGGKTGQTYASLAEMFKYEVYAKVKWQVRGKYIEPGAMGAHTGTRPPSVETGVSTVAMEDLCDRMQTMRISDV